MLRRVAEVEEFPWQDPLSEFESPKAERVPCQRQLSLSMPPIRRTPLGLFTTNLEGKVTTELTSGRT